MKAGEIWEAKETGEKVRLDYIESDGDKEYYVGFTYLKPPRDHEQPAVEHMIARTWFLAYYTKCRTQNS